MGFNKQWLEIVKPIDVRPLAVGEWYREHESDVWYLNRWWFYKSKKQTTHMVVALFNIYDNVEMRNFRWYADKNKWLSTKAPINMSTLEFYKQYWYPNRMYKKYTETAEYKRLIKMAAKEEYITEICKLVFYRIEEYAACLTDLSTKANTLIPLFAKDLLSDFGVGGALASISFLGLEVAHTENIPNSLHLEQTVGTCCEYLNRHYKDFVCAKINMHIVDFNNREVALIATLVSQMLWLCLNNRV